MQTRWAWWAYQIAGAITPAAAPVGSVQYNKANDLGGEAAFSYDDVTNTLSIPVLSMAGSVSGAATITPPAAAGSPTLTLPTATGTIAVTTGALTTGNLAVFDASGRLVDGGAAAGGLIQASKVTLTGGNVSTTSATYVDVTGATVTITTGAHRCIVDLVATMFGAAAGASHIDLLIDGVSVGGASGLLVYSGIGGNLPIPASFSFLTDVLSAASHTFKLQYKVAGGTQFNMFASSPPLIFSVVETGLTT